MVTAARKPARWVYRVTGLTTGKVYGDFETFADVKPRVLDPEGKDGAVRAQLISLTYAIHEAEDPAMYAWLQQEAQRFLDHERAVLQPEMWSWVLAGSS